MGFAMEKGGESNGPVISHLMVCQKFSRLNSSPLNCVKGMPNEAKKTVISISCRTIGHVFKSIIDDSVYAHLFLQ